MSAYLTATGFQQKTLVDIRTELEAAYRAVFGSTVDLSPEGPLGQIIALNSKMIADLWEGASEVYTSRDPYQATGEALDNICAETGVERLAPTASRADGVICWFPLATTVTLSTGSKIKPASGTATYSLESDIAGTALSSDVKTAFRLKISIASGQTMSVTINGIAYYSGYNQPTHLTVQNFVDTVFAPDVRTGIPGSSCYYTKINGVEYVEFLFPSSKTITAATSLLLTSDSMQGVPGNFVSDVPGASSVPALYLDTIATPITNWLGVSQYVQGTDGTDTETDTALRLRRIRTIRSGTATEDALYSAIMRVPGVAYASVTSNRALNTDSENRPGKSVECVVEGGTDQAVATAIWKAAPAGIQLWGATFPLGKEPVVIGADLLPHTVDFSRPVPVYAHVKVTVNERNGEDPTPDNLTQAVKDAVVAWGQANMGLGTNMVLQKFYGPVYSVPSIQLVTLEYGLTSTSGGAVSWSTASSLSVASREFASFDTARVTVVIA